MDKSFYARLDFDKGSVVCHDDNLSLDVVAHFEVRIECVPWVWSELFQAECNAFLLFVEVENNDINLLVELDNFVWVVDASP